MFNTRTALVKHLVSAEHRRLTVLCPWCRGKNRTFTRISDLEVHVRSCHPDVKLPKDRFSRSSGFYYATYAEDYAKIVETVTAYDSDAAYDIRKAVRSWAEGFADRKDRVERWNNGWKEGVKIANGKERSRSREHSKSRRLVRSDRGVGGKENVENGERLSGESRGEGDRRACDHRAVERDVMDSGLKRKRISGGTEKEVKQSRVSVERTIDGLDAYEDDIIIGDGEVVDYTVSVLEKDGVGGKDSRLNTGRSGQKSDGRKGQPDVAGIGGKSERSERRGTGIVIHEAGDGRGRRGQETKDRGQVHMSSGDVDLTAGMEEIVGNSREVRDVGILLEDERAESEADSSSSSSSSSASSIRAYGGLEAVGGIRERALRILKRGAMPVCPPARRDWSSVTELEIECNGQELSWPPANWKALTPDQRLMAHEYAALFLERRKTAEFPSISRKALLDKYAFLALDGEGKPSEEENDADKIDGKIRQYNFTYVKGVAKGEIGGSRMSWGIIKSLEKADRWEDTDIITEKLDSGGVKLRL